MGRILIFKIFSATQRYTLQPEQVLNIFNNEQIITMEIYERKKKVLSLLKQNKNINFIVSTNSGHKSIVDLLKSNGADLNIRNHDGKTAMECAIESGIQNERVHSSLLANLKQAKKHLFSLGSIRTILFFQFRFFWLY